MEKPTRFPTGLEARFEAELEKEVPGWKGEFSNLNQPARATAASEAKPLEMNKPVPPTLCELLREFSTAMLITHCAEGKLRGRPMIVLEVEASGRMWFIASRESALCQEISSNTQVHLAFQKDHCSYLSLNGHASLVNDPNKVASLWNEKFDPWFPDGKTDSHIALIAVTPHDLEYWHHRQPPISGSWDARSAYVHGTKPEANTE